MLALSVAPARVLLLATARIGEGEPVASASGLHRLRLPPLGERETESLLASMLMMPAAARHRLAELLHAACGGNPLHTVEVIAALVDEELLTPAADGTWLAAGAEHWPLSQRLREAIGRRIAGSGPVRGAFSMPARCSATPFDGTSRHGSRGWTRRPWRRPWVS